MKLSILKNHLLILLWLYCISGLKPVFGEVEESNLLETLGNSKTEKQLRDFNNHLEVLRLNVNNIWEKFNGSESTLKTLTENVFDLSFTFCYLLEHFSKDLNILKAKDTQDNFTTNCIQSIKSREFLKASDELKLIQKTKINFIVKEVYNNQIANFDLLMKFTSYLTDIDIYCKIFYALKDEIKENLYDDSMFKLVELSNSIKTRCLFGKDIIDELNVKIRYIFEEKLRKVMLIEAAGSTDKKLVDMSRKLYEFDIGLYKKAIKQTLNEIYNNVNVKNILNTFSKFKSLDEQIYACYVLFEIMKLKDNLYNQGIFLFAKKIKHIIANPSYANFKGFDLNKIKNELPLQVKNTIFSSRVCLENVYHNEYIYSPYDKLRFDKVRRYVFGWLQNYRFPEAYYILELTKDNKWFIKSERYGEYLYADEKKFDSQRRYVFTRTDGIKHDTDQYKWIIEIEEDYCYIKNAAYNEYLYNPGSPGSSHGKYDSERRHTFTWVPGKKPVGARWSIESC